MRLRVVVSCILTLYSSAMWAQTTYPYSVDSLLASGRIQKIHHAVFIKLIAEQYQSLVSVTGEGFSAPTPDLVRKRGVGIRIGYQFNAFEIETGLSTIRPAAGFRFSPNGSYGSIIITRSTDYYHLPLVLRYRLWQPTSKLAFRAGAGMAYNVDLSTLKLAPGGISEQWTIDPGGNRVVLARTTDKYEQQTSFFSAEMNLSMHYQISRHLSGSLEIRRLFGPLNAVRSTATQELFNPSSVRQVEARGGLTV